MAADSTDALSLKGLIQGMTGGEASLCQGTVTAVGPVKVQVSGDEKLALTEGLNLIIPQHLKDHTVVVDISGGSVSVSMSAAGDPSHTHSVNSISHTQANMTVAAGLKAGEQVHLLAINHGKLYFALGRVG